MEFRTQFQRRWYLAKEIRKVSAIPWQSGMNDKGLGYARQAKNLGRGAAHTNLRCS